MDAVEDIERRYRAMQPAQLIELYQRAATLNEAAREALITVLLEKGVFVPDRPVVEPRQHSTDFAFAKVFLARRVHSDTVDVMIAVTILVVPLLALSTTAIAIPDTVRRLAVSGLPGGIIYLMFRDAIGRGTSIGKRVFGLRVVDLRTGLACVGRRSLWRNILDLVPVLNLFDFLLMCIDASGQKFMDKVLRLQLIDSRDVDLPAHP